MHRLALCTLCAALAVPADAMSRREAPAEPLTGVVCRVERAVQGDRVSMTGVVVPETEMSGSYEMVVEAAPGMTTRSSGTWEAAAGEAVSLGRSALTGSVDDIEVSMTVTVDGRSMDCPTVDAG
ncbi:hypothetical protein DXV76_15780 [Rhodobacteraceae bacterium CCMM004]|nr:hypothetical protein DXV76_15780 [Rhodobacteraceae bacterium CCMM004]